MDLTPGPDPGSGIALDVGFFTVDPMAQFLFQPGVARMVESQSANRDSDIFEAGVIGARDIVEANDLLGWRPRGKSGFTG